MPRTSQDWAALIKEAANDDDIKTIIDAVNAASACGRVKRAAVVVACAYILAQNIVNAGKRGGIPIAPDIRAGIMALIDGFAMQAATDE